MQRYIELGAAPAEEPCAQLGADDYHERSQQETRRYIRMLNRLFPEDKGIPLHQLHTGFGPKVRPVMYRPDGVRFGRKSFEHDFGSYVEVVVYYDESSDEQTRFAYDVERRLPGRWPECDHRPVVVYPFSIQVRLEPRCSECGASMAGYADEKKEEQGA